MDPSPHKMIKGIGEDVCGVNNKSDIPNIYLIKLQNLSANM